MTSLSYEQSAASSDSLAALHLQLAEAATNKIHYW